MKNSFIYMLLYLCLYSDLFAFEQNKLVDIKNEIVDSFSLVKKKYHVFYRKKNIPKSIKRKIRIEYGEFRIANAGKKYRATDKASSFWDYFRPTKRLIFFLETDKYYILYYQKGGIGVSTYVMFIKQNHGKVSVYPFSIKRIKTPAEFINAVQDGLFFEVYSVFW